RQPGSAFKPIVYSLALDSSFTAASMLSDAPLIFKETSWTPENYSKTSKGKMTLRDALTHSKNVPTIRLTGALGIESIIEHAKKLGVTAKLPEDLTIGLGTASITLEEMVRTYGVFANSGYLVDPVYITKVVDRTGKILEENETVFKVNTEEQAEGETELEDDDLLSDGRVLSQQNAFLVTSILSDVIKRGSGWRARAVQRPAAGKTGTSNDFTDAWFIGYVPQLLTGVYVGFDNNQQVLGKTETGSRAAAPIWTEFMTQATANMPILPFQQPEGIQMLRINLESGELDCEGKKNGVLEFFTTGTGPTTCHREDTRVAESPYDEDPSLETTDNQLDEADSESEEEVEEL
ncbi:MAG: penicillin-binding protein, partial [Proteobacteria bacterium]|nr:penicillin-binding protein [Pseudomonadota bacterium]